MVIRMHSTGNADSFRLMVEDSDMQEAMVPSKRTALSWRAPPAQQ